MPKLEILATRHLPQYREIDGGISQDLVLKRSPVAVTKFIERVDRESVVTFVSSPMRRCVATSLRLEDCAVQAGIAVSGVTKDELLSEQGVYTDNESKRAQKYSAVVEQAGRAAVAYAGDRNATLVLVTHDVVIRRLVEQFNPEAAHDIGYVGYNLLHTGEFIPEQFEPVSLEPRLRAA